MRKPTHAVIRTCDHAHIYKGSHEDCVKFLRRTNGSLWLEIWPLFYWE